MPKMDCLAVRMLKRKFLYTASRCGRIELRNVAGSEEGVGAHHGVPSLDGGVGLQHDAAVSGHFQRIQAPRYLRVPCTLRGSVS